MAAYLATASRCPGAGHRSRAGAPARRRCSPRALRYAVFPGGHRIRPQLVPRGRARLRRPRPDAADAAAAAIELLHCASLVHDDLPCFDDADIAPRQALGSCRIRRAARGADRRRADRARVRDARARRASVCRASGVAASSSAAAGRRAARHRRGPGLGVRSRRPACRLSARQDRRAVRRRDDGRARRRPARPGRRGARSARSSARPIRSPTTCATCSATPRSSASRSARTPRAPRPNAAAQLGIGGAKARLEELVDAARRRRFPHCPARRAARR